MVIFLITKFCNIVYIGFQTTVLNVCYPTKFVQILMTGPEFFPYLKYEVNRFPLVSRKETKDHPEQLIQRRSTQQPLLEKGNAVKFPRNV